jgi:peptide/histidine transporter 3/4
MAYFGVSTNLVNYLKYRLHEGSKSAANNVTNWEGTGSIAPLVAGYLADAFLGRYWTIVLSMVISAVVRSSPPPAYVVDVCREL